MKSILLSVREISKVYSDEHSKYKLVSEDEGEIEENDPNGYNSAFERISNLTIEDKETKELYVGIVTEGGSDEDDMQITCASIFESK